MNPEFEAQKSAIALAYANNSIMNLIAELATARVEIAKLKAEIEAAKPKS